MKSSIITNYTDVTFLATIQSNLRSYSSFCFSVSFIKKAGLDLLKNDIAAAVERGAVCRIGDCREDRTSCCRSMGWHVIVIWECELRRKAALEDRLNELASEITAAGEAKRRREESRKQSRSEIRRLREEMLQR